MKVLLINSVYEYGSTGRIVAQLRHSLIQSGNQAFVIYGRKSAFGNHGTGALNQEKDLYYICHPFEQKTDIVLSYLFDSHGLHSQKNTKEIIEKIKTLNPDIIHLHNIHGFYLNYPMFIEFLKEYKKPVIWTLHDCWSYTGYCAYYDYAECSKWKTGCQKCLFNNEYPYRVLSRSKKNYQIKKELYENFNVILVTPSKWLKDEISKSMLAGKKCVVIHNDVDLKAFFYENSDILDRYHIHSKKVYIACANVWNNQKGLQEYIRFSNILDENEVLVMIGLTEHQKKMFKRNTIALGRMEKDELRKWYSACSCMVNLTLEDNYPSVNLEARACGASVVTYDTGGSPESAGENAVVVPRKSVSAALEAARKAVRNKENEMNLTTDMSKEYIKLYKDVLKSC